ncbi:MAG: hypothetical protein ACTHM6_04320 [Tepidisphaeraceae bacterium]
MEETPTRPVKASSLNWFYPIALLIALGMTGYGVFLLQREHNLTVLAAGALGVIAVLAAWPLAHALSARGTVAGTLGTTLNPVYDRLEQFSVMLNEISEQQLLSDRAKTVAYREKDREALRRAIQEDLAKKDWEAALVLVDEMDNRFGYKQEAERIRESINQQFADHIRRQVQTTREMIDRHVTNEQWAAAQREVQRLQQQFPTLEEPRKLQEQIELRRQEYKQRLLDEYNGQIARKDIDGAIGTVRKLDFYLTSDEGQGMAESVRNLFKEKLNQLKDRFTAAVHRGQWAEAHRVGESIVNDFPNTQMAKEVRDKLESLKQRALEPQGPIATATA